MTGFLLIDYTIRQYSTFSLLSSHAATLARSKKAGLVSVPYDGGINSARVCAVCNFNRAVGPDSAPRRGQFFRAAKLIGGHSGSHSVDHAELSTYLATVIQYQFCQVAVWPALDNDIRPGLRNRRADELRR